MHLKKNCDFIVFGDVEDDEWAEDVGLCFEVAHLMAQETQC